MADFNYESAEAVTAREDTHNRSKGPTGRGEQIKHLKVSELPPRVKT